MKINKMLALVMVIAVLVSACAPAAAPTTAPAAAPTTAPAAAPTTAPAAAPTTAPASDAVKGKTIGFVNAGPDDYYAKVGSAIKAIATGYGMNYVEVNSDYKPEKELANVQDLAAKALMLSSSSPPVPPAVPPRSRQPTMPIFPSFSSPVCLRSILATPFRVTSPITLRCSAISWVSGSSRTNLAPSACKSPASSARGRRKGKSSASRWRWMKRAW